MDCIKERRDNALVFSIDRLLADDETPETRARCFVEIVNRHFTRNDDGSWINAGTKQFAESRLIIVRRRTSAALFGIEKQRTVEVRRGNASEAARANGIVAIGAAHGVGRKGFVVPANSPNERLGAVKESVSTADLGRLTGHEIRRETN
jgi:hypothetical protein